MEARIKKVIDDQIKEGGCEKCQSSCQTACKTSITVTNTHCENENK
ncbi:MAG: six-cysteine ranthipeptide SCIFF [Armatimonadota bacterium]